MAKKTTTPDVLIEHATVKKVNEKKVRIIADPGYMLRSKHTGHTFPQRITANPAAWEAVER